MNFNKTLMLTVLVIMNSYSVYSSTDAERKVLEKDNTGRNRNQMVTAESQMKGSDSDVEMTRKLREALMADDQLSTNAHNIKIITIKGVVTLKGPVANQQEKIKIENLARSIPNTKRIESKLTY